MFKYLIQITGLLLIFAGAKAQTVDLRFSEFSVNEQLSNSNVVSLAQDQLGFMWFGTLNGLNRFDAYTMKKYLFNDEMNFDITSSQVNLLYSDMKGRLWIGLDGFLCIYNIETDSIKIFSSEEEPRGLNSSYVEKFTETNDTLLLVSDLHSIYLFDQENEHFVEIFDVEHGQISSFYADSNGYLYISATHRNRIIRYHLQSKEYETLFVPRESGFEGDITAIAAHGDYIWIGTDGSGIWRLEAETGKLTNYFADNEYARNVRSLYVDNEDFLWAIDFSGLKLYDAEQDIFQGFYHDEAYEFSIPPRINTIFQDKDKNYWTIHSPGGVGFAPRPLNISRFDSNIYSPFSLSADAITSISEDAEGNLWMGNAYNGIDVFRWNEGRTESYFHDENDTGSLGKGAVLSLFRDSQQRMWVGTYWGGLQRFVPQTRKFESFIHEADNEHSLSGNDIRSVAEDKNGFLWLCVHGQGVDRFDPETGKSVNYNTHNSRLANDFTFDVLVDGNNSVWVATAWGLSVLHEGNTEFQNYFAANTDSTTLLSNRVTVLHMDEQNRVWAGTNEGLNLYVPETNNFRSFSEGFNSRIFLSIGSDTLGNLWIGTDNGLSKFNTETEEIINLSKQDGLISNDFSARAVYHNGLNTLFFGTLHGINYFDASTINLNTKAPNVYITGLQVMNEEINMHNSTYIDKNLLVSEGLHLDYTHKRIAFEFAAINFINPQNNSFAYYLEGFENEWNYSGNNRRAVYTNLSPGRYTFRVKAANSQGVWNNEGASLPIWIKAPFWKTFWFRALMLLSFVALFFSILKVREIQSKKIKNELEHKVEERTREIENQRNVLQLQKEELEENNRLKNNFINILAHDLRSPVYSLVQLTDLLKEKVIDNEGEINPKYIESIARSTRNTYNLLEDLLIWGRSKSGNIEFNFEEIDLYKTVNHVLDGFKIMSENKAIEIINQVPPNLWVYADKNSLKVVLRNVVSNALKFSYSNSKIHVKTQTKAQEAIISITDMGVGMSRQLLERLMGKEEIIQSGKGTMNEEGSGLGITLCKDLLRHNNGKLYLESEKNKGTKVYFTLPLAQKEV